MGSVFISYRRGETAGEARALFNELAVVLGKDSVFMDVDTIALGRDFRQILQERLASCDLMLALIGKGWVDVKNASGLRRLEDRSDFVRLEIESALKRNIPVTPVLVQGAQMPAAEQLPEDIKDFAYRNAFELSHNRWESDIQEMLRRLDLRKQQDTGSIREIDTPGRKKPGESSLKEAAGTDPSAVRVEQSTGKFWLAIVGALAMALVIGGGVLLYYHTVEEHNARIEEARKEAAQAKADAEAQKAAVKAEADKAQAAKDEAAAQAAKDKAAAQAVKDKAAAQAVKDKAAPQVAKGVATKEAEQWALRFTRLVSNAKEFEARAVGTFTQAGLFIERVQRTTAGKPLSAEVWRQFNEVRSHMDQAVAARKKVDELASLAEVARTKGDVNSAKEAAAAGERVMESGRVASENAKRAFDALVSNAGRVP